MNEKETTLIHRKENVLYGLCLMISIIIVIYLIVSIIGILLLLAFAALSLISHAVSMAHIRLNGVRLRESQFPELYETVASLSKRMELKQIPEVYIVESGGLLNAFATKILAITGKNMVVLYSDFVDISLESNGSEIDYVIAHELAHIKRNHIVKFTFIAPAMWIPFIGTSYSRMCEYTCDRMAAYYTDSPREAVHGLLVLAAGRNMYKNVNIEAYLQQYNENKGFFAILTELLSTHPPIPKRIEAIQTFMLEKPAVTLQSRGKQTVLILLISFMIIPAVVIGTAFTVGKVLEDFSFSEFSDFAGWTPLMEASMEGDIQKAEQLLVEGADPNEPNEFGETPLILVEDPQLAQLLLDYGADPNSQDSYGWTALTSAVVIENVELAALLLEAGADPTLETEEGLSAIDYATDYGNEELLQLLESYID
ncbi:M48 family metallopeptidase [Halalkalibacter alkalisediminis]|uniref:M48 family metallopeptidase n=1 Tax=Halalkalibacter alkalisediminis TaxID=935616 RepID=A0ABV6NF66_9BACI|nr:M48 family metallopeptidase [Halalkalibacter alkalisediminis]